MRRPTVIATRASSHVVCIGANEGLQLLPMLRARQEQVLPTGLSLSLSTLL